MLVLSIVFSALIILGSLISFPVPFSLMPMTLQTFFVFLTGLLLPHAHALSAILIYMAAGIIGLPVFTLGGGIEALVSPSGGFIFGFIIAVIAGSSLAGKKRDSFFYNLFVVLVMELCIDITGLPWFQINLDISWKETIERGLLPFIPGDVIKMIAAAAAAKYIYPWIGKTEAKLRSLHTRRNEG